MRDPDVVRPLADPLRMISRLLGWLLVLIIMLPIAGILLELTGVQQFSSSLLPYAVGLLLGIPAPAFIFFLLPRRPANALYLRSFAYDRPTWKMRKAAQESLGRHFRLSGIRDPRRRRSPLDHLALALFFLRYNTPKYMNLEAGTDWRARLWRSLADVRCVLIDVSVITPSLKEELDLCFKCLDNDRILLIGDETHTKDEWRNLIAGLLGHSADKVSMTPVAIWDCSGNQGASAFKADVSTFASGVPKTLAGICREAYSMVATGTSLSEPVPGHDAHFIRSHVVVMLFAAAVGVPLSAIAPSLASIAGYTVSAVTYSLIGWYFIGYLIDTTLTRRLVSLVAVWFLFGYYNILFSAVYEARESGRRSRCHNRIQSIHSALLEYESKRGTFPPSYIADGEGRPTHSWRVLILPQLGYQSLYDQYHFDEPWDGPNNQKLAMLVPEEYRCPSDTELPDGCTSYFLVVGKGLAYEPIPELERKPPFYVRNADAFQATRYRGPIGMNRMMLVESSNSRINWMEPRDLPIEAISKPINDEHEGSISSRHTGGGANCMTEIGVTEFLPQDTSLEKLREYFTSASQ